MKKYFLFHQRLGDFEVPESVFLQFLSFIDCKSDKRHFKLVTMIDVKEPDIIYYYVWTKSSDFTYLGYVSNS